MHLHPGVAGLVVGVGYVERVVKEEWLLVILANKLQRIGGKQIGRIIHALHRHTAAGSRLLGILKGFPARCHLIAQLFYLTVADEKLWIKIVRVPHVHVAIKVVKSNVIGIGEIVRRAHTPFADAGCAVTGALEHGSKRGLVGANDNRLRGIAAHYCAAHVPAGQQHAARWRAHGAPRIKLREPHPLTGHAIQSWRLQSLLPKTTQIAVA